MGGAGQHGAQLYPRPMVVLHLPRPCHPDHRDGLQPAWRRHSRHARSTVGGTMMVAASEILKPTGQKPVALTIDGLSLEFPTYAGAIKALDDVTIEIGASEIVGLV